MRVEFRHGDETIALQMTGMKELLDEKFKSLKLWGSLALLAGSMTGTAVAAKIGAVNGAVHTASHALSYIL